MADARSLAETRQRLHAEMSRVVQELHALGFGPREPPTVDAAGYPVAEAAVVRRLRALLSVLHTDYDAATAELERALHREMGNMNSNRINITSSQLNRDIQSETRTSDSSIDYGHGIQGETDRVGPPYDRAAASLAAHMDAMGFARVNAVAEGSAAHSTGIRCDDVIVSFGALTLSAEPKLGDIAREFARHAEGSMPLRVTVARASRTETFTLATFPGLSLGMHILPLLP